MKNLILFLFAWGILFTSCQDGLVDSSDGSDANIDQTSIRGSENICVASWNTQLLDVGDFFGGPQCEGYECRLRAKKICEQVDKLLDPAPDVVNFQEVFEEDAANALIDCMVSNGYTFHTGFDASTNATDCFLVFGQDEGSGLITFSKFPIVSTVSEDYTDCNGCTGSGFDCLAEKAALLTEIEVSPGCTIFNLNTHLDAGDSQDDADVRAKQLIQLKAFLDANVPPGSPLLISGDFNVKKNTPEYNTLLALLGNPDNTAALAGTVDGITSDSGTTLDYIFGQNINSATYEVYFQDTKCWWEYREEITTNLNGGLIEYADIDFEINGNLDDISQIHNHDIKVSVVTHIFDNEEDIPAELLDKVIRVCKNVVKSSELSGEHCGWFFSATLEIVPFDGEEPGLDEDAINITTFYNNYSDIPPAYTQYFIYKCNDVYAYNPSDHNPVLSCVEFNCE